MRTSVFVGASVDGFIARPNGEFDFLSANGDGPQGFEDFYKTVDCLLIGRKTYETVLGMEGWFYGKKPVYVLSSRELRPAPESALVERLEGEPAEIYADLEDRGYKHVYVDGGLTVQSFICAGLIDNITINRVPVLIGEGISIFGHVPKDVRLEHISTVAFEKGSVRSVYAVVR